MKTRLSLLIILLLLIAGCASGPVYREAMNPGDFGYRDTQLTEDQYRISFSGNASTPRETVENLAMYRAAELALAHDADHFRMASQQTTPITHTRGYGPDVGFGYGRTGWGASMGYGTHIASRTRYETVLQIEIGPQVPASGADIYDARQLKDNLAPTVDANLH